MIVRGLGRFFLSRFYYYSSSSFSYSSSGSRIGQPTIRAVSLILIHGIEIPGQDFGKAITAMFGI